MRLSNSFGFALFLLLLREKHRVFLLICLFLLITKVFIKFKRILFGKNIRLRAFKTNKAKICIHMGRAYYGPIFVFCTRFLMLPFLLNLSFFIKHDEILSWPPTCPAMYEVMRSFGAIKTKTHLLFAFDARFRVCTLFGPRVRNVHTAYSRDVFKESEARKT